MVVWLSHYCRPAVKLKQKNPPPSGSGFWLNCSSQIKTRLPRWSAARSQAAGSNGDSYG
jgi:hypothetical protein